MKEDEIKNGSKIKIKPTRETTDDNSSSKNATDSNASKNITTNSSNSITNSRNSSKNITNSSTNIPTNSSKNVTDTKNDKSTQFLKIMKKKSLEIGIPHSPSTMKKSLCFFNEILSKLEFLNEQMMEIYSSAFLFVISQRSIVKSKFVGKIKKTIFDKAAEEVQEWMKTKETVKTEKQGDLICNLYRITE